jgi:transcriptional regulator with GAF, ATPase, and Fis domain
MTRVSEVSRPIVERQALTERAFVELVDMMIDDLDVVDLLTVLSARCIELLGVVDAGILLADEGGNLRVIGSSNEVVERLELLQVQTEQGPCIEALQTGTLVAVADLSSTSTWPLFEAECASAGYSSVCAVPLRVRDRTLGCLNMFVSNPEPLSIADVTLARALTDVATIAIVEGQAKRAAATREAQLRKALDSRVVIEQAKGMMVVPSHIDFDDAFRRLRSYARARRLGIAAVAESIVTGVLSVEDVRLP